MKQLYFYNSFETRHVIRDIDFEPPFRSSWLQDRLPKNETNYFYNSFETMHVIRDQSSLWTPRADSRTRCAPQYAGVPNPISVLNVQTSGFEEVSAVINCLVMVCSCYSSIIIAGRGSRIPPRTYCFCSGGLFSDHFFVFFHTFYIILSILFQIAIRNNFLLFFIDFWSFRKDFWWFSGAVFSMFFRFVNENTNFSKSLRNTGHGDKNQGLRLEKSETNHKNLIKKRCNLQYRQQ